MGGYQVLRHPHSTSYNVSLGVGVPLEFTLSAVGGIYFEQSQGIVSRTLTYPQSSVWDVTPKIANYTQLWPLLTRHLECFDVDNNDFDQVCWIKKRVNGVQGPLKTFGFVSMNVTNDA